MHALLRNFSISRMGVGEGNWQQLPPTPPKIGKNTFRAIIVKNLGIFLANVM